MLSSSCSFSDEVKISLSPVLVSNAVHTTPKEPLPRIVFGLYFTSILKVCPCTTVCLILEDIMNNR